MKRFFSRHCWKLLAKKPNSSSLRANVVSAAIQPCNTVCGSAGLLRRLRLLAMTITIALLPAIAFAISSGGDYTVTPLTPMASALMPLRSSFAEILVLLATLAGFYGAMRDEENRWKRFAKALGIYFSYLIAMAISLVIAMLIGNAIPVILPVTLIFIFVFACSIVIGLFFWFWRKKIAWRRLVIWPVISLIQLLTSVFIALGDFV